LRCSIRKSIRAAKRKAAKNQRLRIRRMVKRHQRIGIVIASEIEIIKTVIVTATGQIVLIVTEIGSEIEIRTGRGTVGTLIGRATKTVNEDGAKMSSFINESGISVT
jgi:hypothetical protein